MDVRGVVPGIRQRAVDWHMPEQTELNPVAPVSHVREGDDALAGDGEHVGQQALGVTHGLNGLAHDHEIEGHGREPVADTVIQVFLNDVQSALDSGCDLVVIKLKPNG